MTPSPARGAAGGASAGTDQVVIRRSLQEPHAFGAIFDRHAAAIYRFVARRAGPAVAEEVVAETFLQAFTRRATFHPDRDDALPWLFGIATNLLRRQRRADLRVAAYDDVDRAAEGDPYGAADRRIDAERQLRVVLQTLRRMPAAQRDTVLLHAWADLSYDQIAEAMRVPVGTVRSRLNRARATLRAASLPAAPPNGEPRGRADAAAHLP